MDLDLLELYERASDWTGTKVRGAVSELDAPTTCDSWNVRTLLNHMLETQRYFVGVDARRRRCPLARPTRSAQRRSELGL